MPFSSMLCDVISLRSNAWSEEEAKEWELSSSTKELALSLKIWKPENIQNSRRFANVSSMQLTDQRPLSLHTSFLARPAHNKIPWNHRPWARQLLHMLHCTYRVQKQEVLRLAQVGFGIISLDMITIPSPDPYRQKRCFRHQLYPSILMSGK